MPSKIYDVIIVGSGLSGVVAANSLAECGLNILMLEENIHVGGQLLRSLSRKIGKDPRPARDRLKRIGLQFVEGVRKKNIEIRNKTVVSGVFPGGELMIVENESALDVVKGKILLLATGARERFLPFKGWTLPGVISTGATQILMKSSGLLFAGEMLFGGSGLFPLTVAAEYRNYQGRVPAVLVQSRLMAYFGVLSQAFHQFEKFTEGLCCLAKLALSGTPVRYGTKIIEARGGDRVEEVVTIKVGPDGRELPGSEKVYRVRALAVGYGFVPNIELPRLAGCELEFDPDKGGWAVKVDQDLQTSVENVYAAGEITGIGGSLKSINEGGLAAASVQRELGRISPEEYSAKRDSLLRERKRHLSFGRYFNALFRSSRIDIESIPDETIVCRCEGVTMGEIRQALAEGATTPGAVKKATRVVMGNCQGRTCAPILLDILQAATGGPSNASDLFSMRPPVKPVSLGLLAEYYRDRIAPKA